MEKIELNKTGEDQMPVATGILTLIGTAVSSIFAWAGIKKQEEQTESAQATQSMWKAQDDATQKEQFGASLRQRQKEQKFVEKQAEKKWKWDEEQANFGKSQAFANRFTGMLQQEPALRNNLINVWGKGR